jgi:hypothetical protein
VHQTTRFHHSEGRTLNGDKLKSALKFIRGFVRSCNAASGFYRSTDSLLLCQFRTGLQAQELAGVERDWLSSGLPLDTKEFTGVQGKLMQSF